MGDLTYLQYLVISVALSSSIVYCQTCPSERGAPPGSYAFLKAHENGDSPNSFFYLGGLFGAHYKGEKAGECGGVRERGVHNLEAFLWAIRTYKRRYPDSLRGINIGAIAFDSCSDTFRLQQQVANFQQRLVAYGDPSVDPDGLLGYVGPDRSAEAKDLGSYFADNGPLMVSHAATMGELSDRKLYPYFLRTVPSDFVQVDVLVKILQKQNWKYIQMIYSDNYYGQAGRDSFAAAVNNSNLCIVNEQRIPVRMSEGSVDRIISTLEQHKQTRAVVVFAKEDYVRALLMSAKKLNVRGYFTWFGTTAWSISSEVVKDIESAAEGAVTLSLGDVLSQSDNTAFTRYFNGLTPQTNENNPWFKEYWSSIFECYFIGIPNPNAHNSLCDDMVFSLKGVNWDFHVPYTIKAVDFILNGIDKARRDLCALSSQGLCDEIFQGNTWKTIFDSVIGNEEIFNKSTGNPIEGVYTINNYRTPGTGCSEHCYTRIGDYSIRTGQLTLDEAIHTYNVLGGRIYEEKSVCSEYPCLVCDETATTTITTPTTTTGAAADESEPNVRLREESWVIPLLVLTSIGVALVVVFDIYLLCKIFRAPYMKHWRTMWLGQLLLVGILLSYLTLYAFVVTPTKATCGIIRFGVGVSYAMCFSVLLVKLMILLSSETFGYLKGAFQVLMFLFAWGIQLVVGTEWLVLRYPGVVPSPGDPDIMVCQHGDFISQIQALIYVMVLIFICTVMAIRTSRISTNHREGVFIGLCTGFSIPIFLVWTLLGHFINDPAFHDPCLAFGLLATATLMLFVMFLPKVRQLNSMGVEGIYAEDDRNPELVSNMGNLGNVYTNTSPPSVLEYPTKAGPPSVIGYAPSQTGEGSVLLLSNGEVGYAGAVKLQPLVKTNPHALHLRHPSVLQHVRNVDNVSIHSAPLGNTHVRRLPTVSIQPVTHPVAGGIVSNGDNIHATTRVLRMTNDLTGRKTPVVGKRATAENEIPRPDSRTSEPAKPSQGVTDLGSL